MTSSTVDEQLPALPEQVTTEWLGQKLGHKISSATWTRSIFGTASKLFFTITYAEKDSSSRPTHICVKGVFDPVMVASQPWTVSLAQREANFFAKLAPTIRHMDHPHGWWGGVSEEQGIAIMSDLTNEGCTFAPEIASYGLVEVLEGATQLAGLHAQFWGQSQEETPCKFGFAEPDFFANNPGIWNNFDPAMTFMVRPWDNVVREPGRTRLPEYLMDGARVNKAWDRFCAQRNPKFRTLLHGDTHIGNVYFTADGQTRFLDWSAFHFGSCFHDLVYFMTTMFTAEDRRIHEMLVLNHYLESLHRFGGPKLDPVDEDVMVEYKRSFMACIIWLICPAGLQSKERVDILCERTAAAWVDHKVVEVIEAQPVATAAGYL